MADGAGIGGNVVELLVYPACPEPALADGNGWFEAGEKDAGEELGVKPGIVRMEAAVQPGGPLDQRIAEETRRSFEAGRERGRQEGLQAERAAQAAALRAADEQRARQAAEFVARFAQERDRYLQAVEREVVKLALAIAARILRREAQMDPLLLTGAVRVALGQLAGTTEVRLLVPGEEIGLWSEAMAHTPNLSVRPKVEAGDGMRVGDCTLETAVGSVDLGIHSQLAEIERGFFDCEDNAKNGTARNQAETRPGLR